MGSRLYFQSYSKCNDAQALLDKVAYGCELFHRLDFLAAIKQWRIAVDQTPLSEVAIRAAIMRNIGIAFLQLERYQVRVGTLFLSSAFLSPALATYISHKMQP